MQKKICICTIISERTVYVKCSFTYICEEWKYLDCQIKICGKYSSVLTSFEKRSTPLSLNVFTFQEAYNIRKVLISKEFDVLVRTKMSSLQQVNQVYFFSYTDNFFVFREMLPNTDFFTLPHRK